MGTRKLVDRLQKHNATKVGRDRLFDLLRNAGQLVKSNQVLVCDCTYIRLHGRQFAYLFLVSDAYTRRIVGYHVSRDLSQSLGSDRFDEGGDLAARSPIRVGSWCDS